MSSNMHMQMMKGIQENILNFLEEGTESEEKFQALTKVFNDTKIRDNLFDLLSLLQLISKISNNHHRNPHFFSKIERILFFFKDDIKINFSNNELFHIFKSNKRILLFLIDQRFIIFDEHIVRKIITKKYVNAQYPQYFQPEIQPFINENWFPKYNPDDYFTGNNIWVEDLKKELPQDFYEKRKEGENDNHICELIRNDMVSEFIQYVTKESISLNMKIPHSIYETHSFLLKFPNKSKNNHHTKHYLNHYLNHYYEEGKKKGIRLIEYAAFFGSIQIFKYLQLNGVELNESLWSLAIHGKNAEIIIFLKDNVELIENSYSQLFYESIKCHHIDIANYFIDNFLNEDEVHSQDTFIQNLKYYNFAFLENESIGKSSFCKLCKYNYCAFVDDLLKNKVVDVNKKEISYGNYLNYVKIILFNQIRNYLIE